MSLDPEDFFRHLGKKLGTKTQKELAERLGIKDQQISNLKSTGKITALTAAGMLQRALKFHIDGSNVLERLQTVDRFSEKERLDLPAICRQTGISISTLRSLSKKRLVSADVVKLIRTARKGASKAARDTIFSPIVEFLKLEPTSEDTPKMWNSKSTKVHLAAVYKSLAKRQGIYIFYDSRGKALYVGRTTDRTLWTEMNLAFVRKRTKQTIAVVAHPKVNVAFKEDRQIKDVKRTLFELASFVSAYEVASDSIKAFEALLIRAFANDLLNHRIEPVRPKSTGKKLAKRSASTAGGKPATKTSRRAV